MTDWTQVKPGTKVRSIRGKFGVRTFCGFNRAGYPIFETDEGNISLYAGHLWEPIPTTYTLTLTGPTGDSESVEVSREWVLEYYAYRVGGTLGELCAAMLAREENND